MDLCITSMKIKLGGRDENEATGYIPSVGEILLRPHPNKPGKWNVRFRPETREVETELDINSADKAIEHVTNIKKMMVGIQNVLENPGK